MVALRFKAVDVFTQKPFSGNPVAVVLDGDGLNSEQMQRIAAWTNLSETTFVLPPTSSQADYQLRIFTPKQELPFAGHPTLGSAHAVMESAIATPIDGKLRQECLAGIIDLAVEQTDRGNRISLQTPKAKITELAIDEARLLTSALGLTRSLSRPPLRVGVGVVWLIADMGDSGAVAALQPRMDELLKLTLSVQAAGVTVFGKASDGISQVHVRSFAPALGVPEDPVCGSGNASVAAFLIYTGLIGEFGSQYIARQGMQVGRDGLVAVSAVGDSIKIGGYAVTCVDGTLRID
jgi:PhzF family phenazine biosynthesis protein